MTTLNLAFAFEDALRSLEKNRTIESCALPAVVFHMQGDLINSYRHAMDHYLTAPLDAPYLQNSSFGPPYQKWQFFTNKNFEMLQFCLYNLLRYTSRLWHETEHCDLRMTGQHAEAKQRSNDYTTPLVMHRYGKGSLGYRVLPDEMLSVTSFRSGQEPLLEQLVPLHDRTILAKIRAQGHQEIAHLSGLHRNFGKACRRLSKTNDPFNPFESLNEDYWI